MTASTPPVPVSRRDNRRRRLLALAAGGLVLGVGTTVTLAVWNDSEFVNGTFASGQFDLEGSLDGAAFSSDPAAPGKTLTFELDPDLLSPGDVVYAPFAVQLSADTDYEAAVTIATASTGTIAPNLTYELYDVGTWDATCSAATPPTGTALADGAVTAPVAPVFDLTAAEAPIFLCFVVTAGASLDQGQSGTVTWEFAAESGAAL